MRELRVVAGKSLTFIYFCTNSSEFLCFCYFRIKNSFATKIDHFNELLGQCIV